MNEDGFKDGKRMGGIPEFTKGGVVLVNTIGWISKKKDGGCHCQSGPRSALLTLVQPPRRGRRP